VSLRCRVFPAGSKNFKVDLSSNATTTGVHIISHGTLCIDEADAVLAAQLQAQKADVDRWPLTMRAQTTQATQTF
jgi:hypothetical protein